MENIAFIFNSATIWILIPLTALMIPIIAMMVKHQQQMAELVHGKGGTAEIEGLKAELAELKNLVLRQTMALEAQKPQGSKKDDAS